MHDTDPSISQVPGASSPEDSAHSSDLVGAELTAQTSYPDDTVAPLLVLDHPVVYPPYSPLIKVIKGQAQLFLGLFLGTTATLSLSLLNSSPQPMALQEMTLTPLLAAGSEGLSLAWSRLTAAATPDAVPQPPQLATLAKPSPQLQFIDRYYFANGVNGNDSTATEPALLMVDRMYFSHQSWPGPTSASPKAAPSPSSRVAHPQSLPAIGANWLPPAAAFQGPIEVPPPPSFSSLAETAPGQSMAAVETSSPIPKVSHQLPHTLLGVIETNHFGAALVQTNGSSYSVRVGDAMRQSRFVLTDLDQDRAIFSDGQRSLTVNVGERF